MFKTLALNDLEGSSMNYDAVIFDKDGVLLDSMYDDFKWADQMRIEIAKELGTEIDMEISKKIVKAKTVKELEEIAESTGLSLEIIKRMEEDIAKKKIKKMKDGEIQLFNETESILRSIDLPKAVVSNAPYQTTKFTLKNFGIEDYFEVVKSPQINDISQYVELKKPNPKMINDSMEALGSSNAVMIGDSDDDIKAAENAGIDSIYVSIEGDTDLKPTYKVSNLKEILDIVN